MASNEYPQARIVPIRMLQADNAEKFLDGLSYIPGVRRILIHGPGFLTEPPKNLRDYNNNQVPSATPVKIFDQKMDMHVLMGDVIIEACDEKVITTIAEYCETFFEDFPFQILVGKFMKTDPSLIDYLAMKEKEAPDFIGLSDSHPCIEPMIIKQDDVIQCNT